MVFETMSSVQRSMMEKHLELVIEANKNINITRITDPQEALVLHIEDSLSALDELNAAPKGLFGDLGSGAGYPGIPLAIASGRRTVLVESRRKKAEVLDSIIRVLGLSEQVSTFSGRAELLARSEPQMFSVLTARALAKLSVLMELASPLLKRGGHLICYKAKVDEHELGDASRIEKKTGMKCKSIREICLDEDISRTLIVFEKVAKPTVALPRREGEAQKNPL